ncbi:tumor necrosis factor receptor superfamily member 13C [Callospermophilus lateralis]|uniref:tumor necrosis factor receptor superfamily member 13C n=1 Tax=Callospermophilus lateralis TaxID=76772 RepID=UPI004038C912
MRRGARSVRGRDGPAPTPCVQAQCFDPLVRLCVACRLFRTPEPGRASPPSGLRSLPSFPRPLSPSPPHAPAAGLSSQAPGTALQPQESVGAGAEAVLPLPGLLFGAPALLGLALALALALVALMSWRWQRRRRTASLEAPDGGQDEALDNVIIPSTETLDASAPIWSPPREDPGNTPPGHSVPVPATELGSTELVTTKTTGPEQQ